MTKEMFEVLNKNLVAAKASGEQKRIDEATQAFVVATADCQMKTSERVKQILATGEETKTAVLEIKNQMEIDKAVLKAKFDGAKWLWDILKVVGGAGGGALILKAFGV